MEPTLKDEIRRRVPALLVMLATIAAVAALSAADASAASHKTSSSFGFSKGTPGTAYPSAFLGQISSSSQACERGRKVDLFRRTNRGNKRIARARTSGTGQWTIELKRVPTARYFVKVMAKRLNRRNRCLAYKSSTLRFGDS